MTARFVITDHALIRFVERHNGLDHLTRPQLLRVLLAQLAEGVPCGTGYGKGVLYLLPCGLVGAVLWHNGRGTVKTVLTQHAVANMESRGKVLRGAPRPDAALNPAQEAQLRTLAELHRRAGINMRERNAALRKRGYDPGSRAGEFYRAAYQAAVRAYLAWQHEADPPLGRTGSD